MMSAKMATPALLKIKVFWNKGYYVIFYVYEVTNKILSHDSNYILDVVKLYSLFEEWSWFKFHNLGLALGTNLKFYTSLSNGLQLKVRKFWGLILMFVEVTREKLVGGVWPPILNRVKLDNDHQCKDSLNFLYNSKYDLSII